MSLWGTFTGKTQKNAINSAANAAQGYYNQGRSDLGNQYSTAQGRYGSYADGGNRANALYGNYMGINGRGAQQGAFDDYVESPYADAMRQNAERSTARTFNARGMGSSGSEMNALYRRNADLYQQNFDGYLNRLGQMQGQGLQVANQQANLDMGYGNALAGIGNNQAGTELQRGSALANAASILPQNLISLGGALLSGVTPGSQGVSAFGNALSGFGQSVNSLSGSGSYPRYYQGR